MKAQTIKDRILKLYQENQSTGKLPATQQMEGYYRLFRQKFGPDVLGGLDGEPLLTLMHDFSYRDSLVYWLEFKNDSEFPALFGSIAGGSALKYGIFRRKETGAWTTGTPQKSYEIPVEKAVEIARQSRDQLIKGVSIIQSIPDATDDTVYAKLQDDLTREAPDIQNTAWGHKYFHLMCPEKLDDYHVVNIQRFNLIKLLQVPPSDYGRYLCAGRYIALSKELDIPVSLLTTLLNEINGRPYNYWRIGTRSGDQDNQSFWEEMHRESVVSIGWDKLSDLSWIEYKQESKDKLKRQLQDLYYPNPAVAGQNTSKVFNFVVSIQEGDLVLAADGANILGVGRVVGGYEYKAGVEFPHRRPVEWLSLDSWELPKNEGLPFAVYQLKQPQNLIAIEERLLMMQQAPVPPPVLDRPEQKKIHTVIHLDGIAGRIQNILERKRQVILYGPPGTGKTYWAMRTTNDLASFARFGMAYKELSEDEKQIILGKPGQVGGLVRRCTFHPAYGYEDFIEGYRPVSIDGKLAFERRSGIFKTLCEDAQKDTDQSYYLIIDEINRGDIPRIFGELLTLLEKDKRGQSLLLPLSGELFHAPANVFVIGTMNTADRSIALLDTALRRRFGFLELMPDSRLLDIAIEGLPLGPWLDALNERIRTHIGRDSRNLQIGHAYFMEGEKPVSDKARFVRILREDILPLLEEYCYEDYDMLGNILGDQLIDTKSQRFNEDLLEPEQWDQLLVALLSSTPELITSSQVLKTQSSEPDEQLMEEAVDAEAS